MDIGGAVKALQEGHDVRLGDLHLVPCREGRRVLLHALVQVGDRVENWVPTQQQIYSDKWEIVPPPSMKPKEEEAQGAE